MPPWLIALAKPVSDFLLVVVDKLGILGLSVCALVLIVALICGVLKQRGAKSAALVVAETNRDLTKRCKPRTVDDVVKLMNANNNSNDRKEIPPRNDEAERRSDQADGKNDAPSSEDGGAT